MKIIEQRRPTRDSDPSVKEERINLGSVGGGGAKYYVSLHPTDMRKNFEGLYVVVYERLKMDPLSGDWFLFTNRRRSRLKILHWDGSGLWVYAKRLEKGRFFWPASKEQSASLQINRAQLATLISRINLQKDKKT